MAHLGRPGAEWRNWTTSRLASFDFDPLGKRRLLRDLCWCSRASRSGFHRRRFSDSCLLSQLSAEQSQWIRHCEACCSHHECCPDYRLEVRCCCLDWPLSLKYLFSPSLKLGSSMIRRSRQLDQGAHSCKPVLYLCLYLRPHHLQSMSQSQWPTLRQSIPLCPPSSC